MRRSRLHPSVLVCVPGMIYVIFDNLPALCHWALQGVELSLGQEAVNEAFRTQNMRAWFKTHPLLFLVQCAATLVTVKNTFRLGHCDCRKSQNDERELKRTCVIVDQLIEINSFQVR
jgi:hypothetical protein